MDARTKVLQVTQHIRRPDVSQLHVMHVLYVLADRLNSPCWSYLVCIMVLMPMLWIDRLVIIAYKPTNYFYYYWY
jgi:hypothetical protein